MNTTLRSESFHAVGEQIAATLEDAHLALESYAEGEGGLRGLKRCGELLHSVRGALSVAGIHGAGLLAEEMEAACSFLLEQQPADAAGDEGMEALSRAMVQLPAYIERIMDGGYDIPLAMLPILNDLRAARRKPLLSENTLLLLNGGVTPYQASAAHTPSGEDIVAALPKLRPQFQLGLLGWIKGSNSEQNLRRMASVAERIEQGATVKELYSLWWIIGGVIEALLDGSLQSGIALKRLFGQADRELKRLQTGGEAAIAAEPPTDLNHNLLFYVSQAGAGGGKRCAAIRSAYGLSAFAASDNEIEQLRESLAAPSPRLMKTVAAAIREDLGHTKDVLDIFVRTGMQNPAELQAQVGLLRKISDTLGVLGLGALREAVQQRSAELETLATPGADPDSGSLIKLAADLLAVENRLEQELLGLIRPSAVADSEPPDAEFQAVTGAVLRECMVNMAHVKDAISQVLANPGERSVFDHLPGHLRGVSAGLMMLGRTQAGNVLQRIGAAISANLQGSHVVTDAGRLNRLADAIVSLEYYLETLQAGRREPVYMLENAERSLAVLEADEQLLIPEAEQSGSYTQTLQIQHGQMSENEALPPPYEKTRIIEMPVMAPAEGRPDLEILEVFIDEAEEEIETIGRNFPVWCDNPADEAALITVRRSFHTLKGSGRMVGAALIGEYAWSIENLLNRILNKTVATGPEVIACLQDAVAVMPQLLEQLQAGSPTGADLGALTDDLAAFAAGRIPEHFAGPGPGEDEDQVTESEESALDPVLLGILTRETATHLVAVRDFVAAATASGSLVTPELHRACHTLHGSFTMANAGSATGLTEALYQLVEHLYRHGERVSATQLELLAAAADAIDELIGCLQEPVRPLPDVSGIETLLVAETGQITARREEVTSVQPVLAVSGSAEEVNLDPQSLIVESVQNSTSDNGPMPEFDAEIAAIFAEESGELLEAADTVLAGLKDSNQTSVLAELQRHLHTLKGGARMAGIAAMGDFSHELESLLIRINQGGTQLDVDARALLQACIDELHRMREQVASGVISAPADELMTRLRNIVDATMLTPALTSTPGELPPLTPDEYIAGAAAEFKAAGQDERIFSVPEPEHLGELARDLISGKAPAQPEPFPDSIVGAPIASEPAARREMARVDSAMLEDLLNNAGEISISHSRLKQQTSSLQFNLEELGQTVQRLQQQLRLLEMETEAQILFKHQSEAPSGDMSFDPLELDRYSTIQQLSRGLAETASDVNSIKDLLKNIVADTETILSQQQRTASELQDNLMRTRMVPFEQHVPRLQRLVRQQAQESGKQVELVVQGSSGELDRQVLEKMLPPFEHMLRNAVIHGIEKSDQRVAAGKPATATITIRFRREGAHVLIDVSDDGTGLDLAGIRQRAIRQGIIQADQILSDEESAQLILRSGLSTADQLTQSAGRGIGMDVVVSEISKLGGMLAIATEAGKSCTFTVRLPYTLAITQAFIVRSGSESFALPLPTVEGVVRISRADFDQRMAQSEPTVEYGGQVYRLRYLGAYLGLGSPRLTAEKERISLILVAAAENSTALIVDETTENREIVVKPIGALLAGIRGIAGATILGDGRIVVILDAGSLVRMPLPERRPGMEFADVDANLPPLALVVDDSITMRRVTQRLLERNGMRVVTAKDGLEALELLQDHDPAIILLDVEMPRMDGYEFASRVRSNPATAQLPIIMITSRTGEKHRARAIELGVNDYLGKPYQEHDVLDAIRHLLGDNLFGRH